MKKSFFARTAARVAVFALIALTGLPAGAETFRYKYAEGDSWKINSIVREKVYVNRRFSHDAEITNRITVAVSDVRDGSALHDCVFMTSERTSNRTFSWGREYKSLFRRDALGKYDISAEYFMPVVRDVPVFPARDVKPGESWPGTGHEAHDLRDHFGIASPYTVPFNVVYTYDGPVERDGKKLHLIRAEYTLFFDTPAPPATATNGEARDYPVSTMGSSKQRLYWDNELGMLPYYEEDFTIRLRLASGNVLEYRGVAEARITESKLMDREKIAREMNDEIERLGIENTKAEATADGVTITIEKIQFAADSSNLLPSEREKIQHIAALLERYPDKDLLISGHTALAGTAGARQRLSEERAEAVAKHLLSLGVRDPYGVYTRGFGAEKPIAPNDTEENMARNRRVEITILEK
jgi:outer membrane protein OmpA-like peptidoglycan-associated protein